MYMALEVVDIRIEAVFGFRWRFRKRFARIRVDTIAAPAFWRRSVHWMSATIESEAMSLQIRGTLIFEGTRIWIRRYGAARLRPRPVRFVSVSFIAAEIWLV